MFIRSLPLKSADEYYEKDPEAVMSMSSDKKILIPTDGSKYSRSAIEHALDIAKRSNAEVTALTVIDTGKVTSTLHDLAPASQTSSTVRSSEAVIDEATRSSKDEGSTDEDRGQDGGPGIRDQRTVR